MMHKMLLWILLPVLLGMVAISFMDYRKAESVLETQIRQDLQTTLHTQTGVLSAVQQTLNGGLRSMTQLLSFQRLATAAAEGLPEEAACPPAPESLQHRHFSCQGLCHDFLHSPA